LDIVGEVVKKRSPNGEAAETGIVFQAFCVMATDAWARTTACVEEPMIMDAPFVARDITVPDAVI